MGSNEIKYEQAWTFKSKNIAENFDNHVKQSVPLYEETQRMISEISSFYLRNNDCMIDLGCSTGTTIMRINAYVQKNIEYYAIDDSEQMLEIAKKNLDGISTQFLNEDITSADLLTNNKPVSLITALYALQFLPVEKRIDTLRKAYRRLRMNGALILVEKVRSENSFFNELMIDLYHDMKIRNGLTPKDNMKKTKSLRGVMCPVSIDENKRFLLTAGFSKIDIFFKWHNFVGFIAEK